MAEPEENPYMKARIGSYEQQGLFALAWELRQWRLTLFPEPETHSDLPPDP